MRKFNKIAISIIGAVGFLVLILVWDFYAWQPIPWISGWLAARNDVTHGRFRVLGYGLPPKGMPAYAALLRQRYGVEYDRVAFCTVSQETMDYVDAYDGVSIAAINRRFGYDVVKEVAAEAFGTPK